MSAWINACDCRPLVETKNVIKKGMQRQGTQIDWKKNKLKIRGKEWLEKHWSAGKDGLEKHRSASKKVVRETLKCEKKVVRETLKCGEKSG